MNIFSRGFWALLVGALLATSLVVGLAPTASAETTVAPAAAVNTLPSPPPVLQPDGGVVTSDPLPTVQIDNGYVWAQATIGTTVYAAGMFVNARAPLAAPGTSLTARNNILAFDITTGVLLPFAPEVNGVIRAITASPDGSRIYIGGSFNSVNGQARFNIAALDAQTGQLVPGFQPAVGGSGVYALVADGASVYAGGLFTQGNGVARKNLAAFNAANGALVTSWSSTTDRQVDAMVMDPGGQHVIIGGRFSQVNDNGTWRGLAALEITSGAPDPSWQATQTIKNGATSGSAGVFALSADQTGVYGTGWGYPANVTNGNLEGTFALEAGTGEVRWIADCLGDHYGVYSTGTVVYSTNHTHACSTMGLWPEQRPREHRYAEAYTVDVQGTLGRNPHAGWQYNNWEGTPAPAAYSWFPDFAVGTTTGMGQAGLSITGAGEYISIAGEFRSVNNRQFEGIVRFSTNPSGGSKDGPRTTTAAWGAPLASSFVPGRVGIVIRSTWDRDDRYLTYELMRSGSPGPVATQTVASGWWDTPMLNLQDVGATPGIEHTYTVVVRDSDGNAVTSQPVTATAVSGDAVAYANAVLDDEPSLYYPLGTATDDWAGTNPPIFGTGATPAGDSGGVAGSASGATNLSGTSSGNVTSTTAAPGPNEFSAEVWFKKTGTGGGKILGYGSSRTGSFGSHDRHVYMSNNGQLVFGVNPGSPQTVTTSSSYNDGEWHHVVASLGQSGMTLYVDGQVVASNPDVTTAQAYNGYWRLGGGDNISSWPSPPTSTYFSGQLDEFAVYPRELSASSVASHYATGMELAQPTANFTFMATDLDVSFDAGTSSPADGATLVGYTWDFGDSSPVASGIDVSHTYAASGDYVVTLTVEDSEGLVSTQQQTVTVVGPNVIPEAAFTATPTGIAMAVDASASSDVDGAIVSYQWDWGDGSSDITQTSLTSHSYDAPGTYSITLTVIDDRGGSASVAHEVTVTHADPVAVFTTATDGLSLAADASGSSASDGATLTYSWDWGDNSPVGAGQTGTHNYAQDGTYAVTLTVTDSLGGTAAVSQQVTVTASVFAVQDDFNRTVPAGWGVADQGGTWTPVFGC